MPPPAPARLTVRKLSHDLTLGRTALDTGASRGIGHSSALALAKAAQVLVHYGQGKAEARLLVEEIRRAGGNAETASADLAAADGKSKLIGRCWRRASFGS